MIQRTVVIDVNHEGGGGQGGGSGRRAGRRTRARKQRGRRRGRRRQGIGGDIREYMRAGKDGK